MPDLREDFAAFARALGVEPWQHQLDAAASEEFVTVIAAARRTGKTTLVELLAAWTCFRERGVRAVILSATQDASRRVTENLGERLQASPLTRGAVVDGYVSRIRLANGSEIVSLPASQRQVRGYGRGVKLLVIDEAGFVPEELWRAAHYIALDERANGSRILLTGTPWGPAEHFFRQAFLAGRSGDADHSAHHWTFEVNPGLDRAYLERQRDRVSPSEYAAEVLGEWSDAAGALFPQELLDSCTADVELPAISELDGPARGMVGLDYGVSFDRSAACAIFRVPVASLNPDLEPVPRFVVIPRVWPVKTPLTTTVQEIASVCASFAVISSETSGVGAGPSQELAERVKAARLRRVVWNMVATTAPLKTAGYSALLALMERGQLILPRDPDLLRQLAGLRFEHGERGFTRIEAENPATHDDVADALMLATAPHRRAHDGKRIVTALQLYASAANGGGEPFVPRTSEVLTTGAGVQVWRCPPLQGVGGGRELTWPRDFDRAAGPEAPTAERIGRFTIDRRYSRR